MDEFPEADEWLRARGTIFRNRVVDLTTKNGYFITCTWVQYYSKDTFFSEGNDYRCAVVSMFDNVKDTLFGICNEIQ